MPSKPVPHMTRRPYCGKERRTYRGSKYHWYGTRLGDEYITLIDEAG